MPGMQEAREKIQKALDIRVSNSSHLSECFMLMMARVNLDVTKGFGLPAKGVLLGT
jgi:hypothetical protein